MKHILSRDGVRMLEQVAWSRVLLAFDFDGTLAPIVKDPAAARLSKQTRRLLAAVAARYPSAVISGRGRADVAARLEGLPLVDIVGNHGLEPFAHSADLRGPVEGWTRVLRAALAGWNGVEVEDKGMSVAIHFRQSRQKKAAHAAILQAIRAISQVRVMGGKQVVNLLPDGAPHKGTALERVRSAQGCDTALFVGDDETDEDVFALDQPGQLVSIRVGANRTSAARYYVRDRPEVDRLLERLIQLRPQVS